MHEKYCLKWNDFKETIAGSWSILKKEEDFFDVTLVSEDQTPIFAHKVVLSACSSFFKSILKNNPHQHPLLYLGGISSNDLQLVTDYIYHGEVQVHQNDIDKFLDVTQKLKVSGLNQDGNDQKCERTQNNTEHDDFFIATTEETDEIDSKFTVAQSGSDNKRQSSQIEITTSITDINELDHKISELILEFGDRTNRTCVCKICGKTTKGYNRKIDIQRHVEVHIDGISLPCPYCGKELRSRNGLRLHKCK